jgi:hypothetical protein
MQQSINGMNQDIQRTGAQDNSRWKSTPSV